MYFIQTNAIHFSVLEWQYVCSLKRTYIESPQMVSRCSFAFTIKSFGDILRLYKEVLETSLDVLKMSSRRRNEDVFKKGRRNFNFRSI